MAKGKQLNASSSLNLTRLLTGQRDIGSMINAGQVVRENLPGVTLIRVRHEEQETWLQAVRR
jgi:hypothetical protein